MVYLNANGDVVTSRRPGLYTITGFFLSIFSFIRLFFDPIFLSPSEVSNNNSRGNTYAERNRSTGGGSSLGGGNMRNRSNIRGVKNLGGSDCGAAGGG